MSPTRLGNLLGDAIGGISAHSRRPPSPAPVLSAEALAAPFPALLIAAERVAATVAQGVHGRRRVGPGESFWQFRRYQPGDPAARIDWRKSAKSQRVYVRQTEWEAAQSVWLWRDGSPSMGFRSSSAIPTKKSRAELLVLATAVLLARGGERVALLDQKRPPATGRAALFQLAQALEQEDGAAAESLPPFRPLPRHGTVILVGDFLSPLAELRHTISRFASQGVRGHVVHVLDPAEETLPYDGRIRFAGFEREQTVLIGRVEAVRDDYRRLITAQRNAVGELCQAAGWTWSSHRTDHAAEPALLALYLSLGEA